MYFIVGIIVAVVFFLIYLNVKKARKLQEATLTLIISIGAIIFSLVQIFTVIPAGTVGVVDFLGNYQC
jgi:glucan phosphoethanolaminetransferase (alkaline phosphatase superfamily)